MGQGSSKPSEEVLRDLPDSERYFGLENFGNTCYCNSVLQSLYFCKSFRNRVLEYKQDIANGTRSPEEEETILSCLADLFELVARNKKKCGSIAPRKFVGKVKSENELFRSFAHQDAHEFLSYLLNDIAETLSSANKSHGQDVGSDSPPPTWIDELFRGKLVTETKCLWCENVTKREEPFYDLSLEIEKNCSLTACLQRFSSAETLRDDEKFFCDRCGRKQEAVKRMRIGSTPRILCCHFKRFKYIESVGQMRKLTHRVVFPFDLKLRNTTDTCPDTDARFSLFAVVVHMGAHMNHGHYVALIKSHDQWLCFDDDQVMAVTEAQVRSTFGHPQDPVMRPNGSMTGSMDHGYILFYEMVSDD